MTVWHWCELKLREQRYERAWRATMGSRGTSPDVACRLLAWRRLVRVREALAAQEGG